MNIAMELPHHSVVGIRCDDAYMDSRLTADANNDVETLLPLFHRPGHNGHPHKQVSVNIKGPRAIPAMDNTIGATKNGSPSISSLADMITPPSPDRSTGSLDEDEASHITSITLELCKAAKKTIRHAKSRRAIHAMVPVEVKESLLEENFPHIRGKPRAPGPGSVDSMIAERSVDSTKSGNSPADLDQVLDERNSGGADVDYNDCVATLTPQEMLHLRNAMCSYDKQRVTSMMEHLADQMQNFHQLLDENHDLTKEIARVKREKDELEKSLIEMKLNLAQSKSREDHHQLNVAKLEMDLKRANDTNNKLQLKLGEPDADSSRADRKQTALTRSLTSAEDPSSEIRNGEPPKRKNRLLTRSWFGKDSLTSSFLDRPASKEDNGGQGLGASFLDRSWSRKNDNGSPNGRQGLGASFLDRSWSRREVMSPPKLEEKSPPKPLPSHRRSRSYVEPKKVKSNESDFMHWNCSENSTGDEEKKTGTENLPPPPPKRSYSFVDPKHARRGHDPIGSDVFLRQEQNYDGAVFDSRSTFLSNITDITFEDEDAIAAESEFALIKASLITKNHLDRSMPKIMSGEESHSTLEFEPAKPQLQKSLSLRKSSTSSREVEPETSPLENFMSLSKAQGENPPQQKAASLRGRKNGGKSSAGNAFLAFC